MGTLALLTGCGVPVPVAGPRRTFRIGVTEDASPNFITALKDGLYQLGYGLGQLDLQFRAAQRPEQYPGFAAELARLRLDVFVVGTVSAALAVREAAPTLPIVFVNLGDPVGAGLAASLARPGGNATGLSSAASQLGGKRLQLLKECLPRLARVAVLRNPDEPGTPLEYAAIEAAAGALGVGLQGLEVRRDADFPSALGAVRTGQVEGLIGLHDALMLGNRHRVLGFALQERLPTVFDQRIYVEQVGLISYGPNLEDSWRRAAAYVDKILKGARPADLPIEQPTRFDLVLNLRFADLIGMSVPPAVLEQATEVIR